METTLNPFVIGKYMGAKYFCDRKKESDFLIKQIVNGRNVALISPRRLGKTGLIHHCFNRPELKKYYTFFVDIYATTSLAEFICLLSKAIYEQLKPKGWKKQFFQIVRSLRASFKLNHLTGEPSLDIGIGEVQTPQVTLDEIFEYLENADRQCVVAIDEFQQIGTYEERNVEALLRTKIQQCSKTQFIFSGSKRHIMSQMFNSASKPFYQSAISMGLEPIPIKAYVDFAVRLFKAYGKDVEQALVEAVYQQFNGCTWFVQMMMNELFSLTGEGEVCNMSKLDAALANVIQIQEDSYKDLLARLAPKQKMVLQAIAKAGMATNITSSAFIKKYSLPSASSVQSAVKPLLKEEIITKQDNAYRVYDYFFAEWLRRW